MSLERPARGPKRVGHGSSFSDEMSCTPCRRKTNGGSSVLCRNLIGAISPVGYYGKTVESRRAAETTAGNQSRYKVRQGLVCILFSARQPELPRTGQDLVEFGLILAIWLAALPTPSCGTNASHFVLRFQRWKLGVGNEVGCVPAVHPLFE